MSVRRPRVGLTTYYKHARWGDWERPAALVPAAYVEAVVAAGGTPLLIPPLDPDPSVVEVLDALIVIGGSDVDPAHYGRTAHQRTVPEPYRDEADLALVRAALARHTPLLAICRGAQVLNVALGGTLIQHLPDVLGHSDYRPAPAVFGSVAFRTEPGSRVAAALGAEATAPCYHHQAIEQVAPGLRVTARSADALVQAIEPAGGGWALGVQFHPEENHADLRLFTALVEATRVPSSEGADR